MSTMKVKWKQTLVSYSFVLPYLSLAALFSILPMILIVCLSFTQGSLLNLKAMEWIGFDNFLKVFSNANIYLRGFLNTLLYIAIIIPLGQFVSLLLAFLIRRKSRTNAVFETVFFMPLIISMVAGGVIFAYVLSQNGPLNYLLMTIGLPAVDWFGNPFMAKLAVCILEIWKGATFFTFIYVAALRGIPSEYSDAAKIDGCSWWQEIWRITLPMIKNAILLNVVMTTIFIGQIFDSIFILTNGGPVRGSESVVFFIYRVTLLDDRIGIGAAMSLIFMAFILLISLIQMRTLRSDTEY
ncbi:carbohydrate ABC transporter permease [Paenibacillus eucommiae]|uniref:ABC-type sugar transport system permease subunit n=1 Tax=Paenibacillus eucommiae TaxID=1355755 RepID=A0ABS4J1Z1_9BACL|nr:sugar ABC transporter permease [Paenibacillus eucommiae]MBP1993862.1 ABC-type sugar transport system permease subunit [Paenibacillus eucommiae]